MKMKKKLLCIVMSLIMVMGLGATFSFAAVPEDGSQIVPYDTASVNFTNKRISPTKATSNNIVQFSGPKDHVEVEILLQKKNSGRWVTATDIRNYKATYRGQNRDTVTTYDEWTVKKGVLYRIALTSRDWNNGDGKYIRTTYSNPF